MIIPRLVALPNVQLAETAFRIDWPDGGNTRLVLAHDLTRGQMVHRFCHEIRNGSAKGEARWMLFCNLMAREAALRDWTESALYKRLNQSNPTPR